MHMKQLAIRLPLFATLLASMLGLSSMFGRGEFARPAFACSWARMPVVEEQTLQFDVIVIGTLQDRDTDSGTLVPEAYLKGPVVGGNITLEANSMISGASCHAEMQPGDRVLVFLKSSPLAEWPLASEVYFLRDGNAVGLDGTVRNEQSIIDAVRGLTTQYAVPPSPTEDGAGIDWGKTVLPVGGAVLAVFAVSLVLMRQWHRIDPS